METINTNGTPSPVEVDPRSNSIRASVHGLAVDAIPADASLHLEVQVDGEWKRGGVSWVRGDENEVRFVELLPGDTVRAVEEGTSPGTYTVKISQ